MDAKTKAQALLGLADKLDFHRAGAALDLTDDDWRDLLTEAALALDPDAALESAPVEPPRADGAAKGRPVLFTDGASRGNPGPAAAGAALYLGQDKVGEVSAYLGRMTNNQAEYRALLLGLEKTLNLGFSEVSIRSDSQLMVRQIEGAYKVRDAGLKPLYDKAMALLKRFGGYDILHIGRGLNNEADGLANRALDNRQRA